MKANEAKSSSKTARFEKVKDDRQRPVRGLWKRGERFYAQLSVIDPNTGKKRVKRLPLVNTETKEPVQTRPQAIAALAWLRTHRADDDLPILRRTPKFNEYVDRYLERISAGQGTKRPRTISKERTILKRWSQHLGETRLDRITKPMIVAFRDKRQADGLSPRTLNIYLLILRSLLTTARDAGWLKTLPMDGLKALKTTPRKRALVTLRELEAICAAAFLPRFTVGGLAKAGETGHPLAHAQALADYIRLMAFCGARRDETLALRWQDVDFEKRQLSIGMAETTKNREARRVDFNARLLAHLRDMVRRRSPDSQWLFPSPRRGDKDLHTESFTRALMLAREAAGLPHISSHDCRHHFVSMCVMSGIDFMTIAAWVGHKDGGVLIGKVYGHLANEHRQLMAEKLNFEPVVLPQAVNH